MRTTKDLNKNSVGADASTASKARQNKGITLIALVITIIVMLILVAVTISMAVNGGLFDYAGKATGETQNAIDAEQTLGSGKVEIDGVWYNSIDDYINNNSIEQGIVLSTETLNLQIPVGYDVATAPVTEQLTAILNEIEGTVTWTSDNELVATVSNTGLVTAISTGTANITASCEYEGTTYTKTCKVTIALKPTVEDFFVIDEETGTVSIVRDTSESHDGIGYYYSNTDLCYYLSERSVVIPETVNGITVKEIVEGSTWNGRWYNAPDWPEADFGFWRTKNLDEVFLPDTVEVIQPYAFEYSSLKHISLSKNLKTIGASAFKSSGLCEIEIPNGVESLGASSFAYCKNLTKVDLPNSLVSTGSNAFQGCSALKEIAIPERYFGGWLWDFLWL